MKLTPRPWSWNGGPPGSTWFGTAETDCPVLWQAWLPDDPAREGDVVALLSADERARLDRLQRRDDKRRYIAARGLLRLLVGAHLGIPAGSVKFDHGAFGKPFVDTRTGATNLHFNVSHSGALILLGFSVHRAIGVDVEEVRQVPDVEAMAARVLSGKDYEDWLTLAPDERLRAFYRAWARREAGLKALGLGLGGEGNAQPNAGLLHFEVDVAPGYAGAAATVAAVPRSER